MPGMVAAGRTVGETVRSENRCESYVLAAISHGPDAKPAGQKLTSIRCQATT